MTTNRPRIVFVTFGSGSGDLVKCIALYFALQRQHVVCDLTAITNCEFHHLAERYFDHYYVKPQPEMLFDRDRDTDLFAALSTAQPDLVIVAGVWLPMYPILPALSARTVLLMRKVPDPWLSVDLPDGAVIGINPQDYDLAVSIEPNFLPPGFEPLGPLLMRNHDEILTAADARDAFGAADGQPVCVVAQNGMEGELSQLVRWQSHQTDRFHVFRASNRHGGGLFPLAEYAAGIDYLIGGAGYNLFYESRYFQIPATLVPFRRNGDDQAWRVATNADIDVQSNGADSLALRLAGLLEGGPR